MIKGKYRMLIIAVTRPNAMQQIVKIMFFIKYQILVRQIYI